jgi:hypothetical protein
VPGNHGAALGSEEARDAAVDFLSRWGT